jgi:ribosomal-protein-alanine N-acetyltransferase
VLQDVFFVFEEKKIFRKILGFVAARYSEDGQSVMIRKIAVHPRHRNKRIGTRLIEAVLDKVREMNVREVDLHVHIANTGGVRLYERFGFIIVRIEQPDYGEGEDFYLMRIKLCNPSS